MLMAQIVIITSITVTSVWAWYVFLVVTHTSFILNLFTAIGGIILLVWEALEVATRLVDLWQNENRLKNLEYFTIVVVVFLSASSIASLCKLQQIRLPEYTIMYYLFATEFIFTLGVAPIREEKRRRWTK
jgi:hypothetical protein